MQLNDVEVSQIEVKNEEIADNHYRCCAFCERIIRVGSSNFESCRNLSGGEFYCPFCLRHCLHHRSSRNVLIVSYRGVIGYYYYRFYDTTPHRLWKSQIESMIDKHSQIGLQNPVFAYEPSAYLWFIDFNRIGTARNKAPVAETLKTCKAMLESFELKKHLTQYANDEMWRKYLKAINLFYEKRQRPADRRMLIPTLEHCIGHEPKEMLEMTREFTKSCLILK